MMQGIQLQAVDTLFFRDSTPFSSDSASQDDVGGQFPPFPPTVVGALRASLARCNGWNGCGRWPDHLNPVLGDGSALGSISFQGPFLLRDGKPLFPAPRHLLGRVERDRWLPCGHLLPGRSVLCDLGTVRLPEPQWHSGHADIPEKDLVPPTDQWLTSQGMNDVLCGQLPSPKDIVPASELWRNERRIGLQRDNNVRTAIHGMLYSTRHVRFDERIGIGMRFTELPATWSGPSGRLLPLGGERRMAECSNWSGALGIVCPRDKIATCSRFTVMAITPLDLAESIYQGRAPLTELGGARVVSACLDRQQRIGGWSTLAREPLDLQSLIPAGSVLFCESGPGSLPSATDSSTGLAAIGARQSWGFGLVFLGIW